MTGQEHYKAAEKLLESGGAVPGPYASAAAQAHATLALAAAVALHWPGPADREGDLDRWHQVIK